MSKVIQILWKFFLVSFPFSLHFVLYEKATYRFGNFNPWVTGFLFLPEILLGLIFLLPLMSSSPRGVRGVTTQSRGLTRGYLLITAILFLLNTILITPLKGDIWLLAFFLLHVLGGILFYYLWKAELIPQDDTIKWLLYGALIQVLIAFFQVKLNHSVGLSMLGEPYLSPETLNVAKNSLEDGSKAIRGYGTFLHPNILGVYLMTILFASLPYLKKLWLVVWPAILLFGIYLTGSQAAMLTTVGLLVLMGLFKLFRDAKSRKVVVFGLFGIFMATNVWFFFNSQSVQHVEDASLAERLGQNTISLDMMKDNVSGVGVHNFTLEMENYAENKLKPWEFQPVHNVYFLVLNEMGVQGLIFLLLLILLILNRGLNHQSANVLPFMGLVFVASFDHLLMTSYIGVLMIGLALSQLKLKV